MQRIGYYAKDKQNNLFLFEHSKNSFYIIKDGIKIKSNIDEFEIIEVFNSVG
jgi:hypothetical protein